MNDNDLNEMLKKAQSMIQNNQIPDDIKALINNFQNSNSNTSNVSSNTNINNTYKNNSYNYNSNYKTSSNDAGQYSSNYGISSNNSSYNNVKKNNSNYDYYSNSISPNKNTVQNNNFSNNNNNGESHSNTTTSNIDIETLMKIQNIMSKLKNSDNDDMSKLLLSLKPYLRDGKKEKIDEYIQLIKMGKITQFLDLFGGEKK